jgi:hypothetical protein
MPTTAASISRIISTTMRHLDQGIPANRPDLENWLYQASRMLWLSFFIMTDEPTAMAFYSFVCKVQSEGRTRSSLILERSWEDLDRQGLLSPNSPEERQHRQLEALTCWFVEHPTPEE